nr:TadG family pilus assembly protein [Hydrogenophaga sp.]
MIHTVIAMSLIVIALVSTELGHLFHMKRELQKATDLAALAGAGGLLANRCDDAIDAARHSANGSGPSDPARNLPASFSLEAAEVRCGYWAPDVADDGSGRHFEADRTPFNAVRVSLQKTPPLLLPAIPGNAPRTIQVEAIAARQSPQAALTVRSTLLNLDSTQASLLNQVTGALLGSAVNLSAAGWNGLLQTQVRLLDYLVALGATAGDYESVLDSRITLARLFDVAAELLQRDGHALQASALQQLGTAAAVRNADIRLGDLLSVASGTPASALNMDVQVFSLVQSTIQLANGENAAAANLAISLPGLAGLTSQIKVIEKPQHSAIGNPELINPQLGDSDPARIAVRTAQVRTLHSVQLNGLSGAVSSLTSSVTAALSPLINFLGTVSTLNLGNIVTGLVGGIVCGAIVPCPESKIIYTQVLPSARVDLSIDAGLGSARVTDHSCEAQSKSLSVHGETALAHVRVGQISQAFSSSQPIRVDPVSLIEVGYTEERYASCLLNILLGSIGCSGRQYKNVSGNFVNDANAARRNVVAGFGLQADMPVAGSQTSTPLLYAAPAPENLPEIDAPPYAGPGSDPSFQAIQATDIVASLGNTLNGLEISMYQSSGSGALGALLNGTVSLINNLLNTLKGVIRNALAPLLDPVLNAALRWTGIDLAQTEIGARLSCQRGATLVY